MKKPIAFNWKDWIGRIEVAAEKNNPLEINLSQEEWGRLKQENLTSIKKQLSDKAAARLILLHGDALNENRYFLQVVRYGQCFPVVI